MYVHSSIPKIKEFIYDLRVRNHILTSPYMKKFEEILTDLIFFITDTSNKDAFLCEGTPHKKI
jgi:hypothetical protein